LPTTGFSGRAGIVTRRCGCCAPPSRPGRTQLHADALITLDRQLAEAAKDLVTVSLIEALY